MICKRVQANFVSIKELSKANYTVVFKNSYANILDEKDNTIVKAPLCHESELYEIRVNNIKTELDQINIWHQKLGHLRKKFLKMN